MENLETPLTTPVDKARENSSGAAVEIFIKPRDSTMFGHLEYSMEGPGPSLAVLVPNEDFQQ